MWYKNRVAVVTGSSRGIGKSIAEHLLKHGAKVIGLSRGEGTIEQPNYLHESVNLAIPQLVEQTFFKIKKDNSQLDILINNAGVLTAQHTMILSSSAAEAMLTTNILGTFVASREAAKLMKKNSWGRIVNISSMAASLQPIGDSVYAASKVAVNILANVMAKEFASFNITCNTLAISASQTEILNKINKKNLDTVVQSLPLPRFASEDDIMNVLDFYLSEKSDYITGQTLYLGGVN